MMRSGGSCPELLRAARFDIVPHTRGNGLDIGRGEYKAFPHFIGVREAGDDTIKPPVTADFVVPSFDEIADKIGAGSLDFAFIWGVERTPAMTEGVVRLLKDGGRLITLDADGTLLVRQFNEDGSAPVLWPPPHPEDDQRPRALVIRYGAIGDMIQTASLLPALRREGFHVSVNCHPNGEELLRLDPHVDAFVVQDQDQVPNHELVMYWEHLATRYERIINLCETVEGTLLAHPGRSNHRWPQAVRHHYMNRNYLQFMAEVAELPYVPGGQFYPSAAERDYAVRLMADIEARANLDLTLGERSVTPFVVVWALAGSSVHKFYPHQDSIVGRLMLEVPNAHVIFLGDEYSRILEAGWENEPRVTCLSGKTDIRTSVALAQLADLVIGPETGVLNAVAFEHNAKVVMLSHSSEENLTRDWVNTEAVFTSTTPCYPCHRLHFDHKFCPQEPISGAAMCQADLAPATVWEAVQRAYIGWGTVRRLIGAA